MNTLQHKGQYEEELHESPLLKTTCRYPAVSSQMNQKIETASTVLSQYLGVSTSYKYDAKGHLVEASMPTCYEDYSYNSIGQRISMLHTRKGIFHYAYDAQGKLAQVNDTCFQYDSLGRLSGTTAPNIPAKRFVYERVRIGELDIDRLATFQDSTGKSYTYSYTPNNPLPAAVHCYGQPVVTYQWDESGAFPRLLGCTTPLATWQFSYLPENDGRLPDTVILTGPVVAKLGYWDLKSLQCKLGYDHLGTVKLIADPFSELVKDLLYDSFGNIVSETEQRIYFPLGFAGGLRDIATSFVCFGFRDYDPSVGRFTTPDPALDLRGDGDIYDYCVDDPVNRMDAAGLEFTGSGNHDPVKMKSFRPQEQEGYWRTIPEPGACKKCLEMAKQKFTSPPERPHPNCKCEIEFVGKMIQNKYVKNDIMERLSPYVAVKVTYRSKSHYADTYLETFTSIPALLPNDATQKELDSAYEFAIHILDICHLAGNIPKDLVPDFSNIVAKEAVELALEGWTKDDIAEKLTIKAAQTAGTKILQQLLGALGAGLGKVLLYPSEANPLTPEEKRKMKQ